MYYVHMAIYIYMCVCVHGVFAASTADAGLHSCQGDISEAEGGADHLSGGGHTAAPAGGSGPAHRASPAPRVPCKGGGGREGCVCTCMQGFTAKFATGGGSWNMYINIGGGQK